ncbi:hypothetical protein VB005_09255 [Metarhizium brunneum]
MAYRSVYLAKYRGSPSQRAHFAIFIPNSTNDNPDLDKDWKSKPCMGTVIHVVGEPLMKGYSLEFKRNECSTSPDIHELVFLGTVDSTHIHDPPSPNFVREAHPRQALEQEIATIAPPPRGQDIRAPIDGVRTKRCQEWTMECLSRLEEQCLISSGAVDIAQSHRDAPNHGIFGQSGASKTPGSAA